VDYQVAAREAGDSLFIISDYTVCAIARFARSIRHIARQPRVPLRSTPGFMLSPRSAG